MKYLLAPFHLIYKLYFAVIFIASLLVFFPLFLIVLQFKNGFKVAFGLKRVWSKTIEILCFVPLSIKGKHHFPAHAPYVIVANHASYLDIILMYGVIPHQFKFLGKVEVLKTPLLSYVFGKMDIPVDRSNHRKALESINRCKDAIDEGYSIAIFPEGGMPAGAPKLHRFKNGAFKLAIEKQVPVVPITFQTNYYLFYDHTDLFTNGRPGIARTVVHPPIDTTGMTADDLLSLRNQTFRTINSALLS